MATTVTEKGGMFESPMIAQLVSGFVLRLFEQLPLQEQDTILNAMMVRFKPYIGPLLKRQVAAMVQAERRAAAKPPATRRKGGR